MEYFNDITFIHVEHKSSTINNPLVPPKLAGIGVMCKGPAIFCFNDTTTILECPFLYWNHADSPDRRAWRTPRGVIRQNFWVSAYGERMERMVSSLDALSETSYLHLEDPSGILEVLERLKKIFDAHDLDRHRQTRMVLIMEELMSVIQRTVLTSRVSERMAQVIASICSRISLEPEKEYDVSLIAKELNLSEIYFRRCFTRYAASSPHDYVLKSRYALAMKLLRESSLQIQEVAERCGFPQLRSFSTFFRKHSGGVSPSRFRKMFL